MISRPVYTMKEVTAIIEEPRTRMEVKRRKPSWHSDKGATFQIVQKKLVSKFVIWRMSLERVSVSAQHKKSAVCQSWCVRDPIKEKISEIWRVSFHWRRKEITEMSAITFVAWNALEIFTGSFDFTKYVIVTTSLFLKRWVHFVFLLKYLLSEIDSRAF